MENTVTPDNTPKDIAEPKPMKERVARAHILRTHVVDKKTYEVDDRFRPYDQDNPMSVHTTAEMLDVLRRNKDAEIDARIMTQTREGGRIVRMNRDQFLQCFTHAHESKVQKMLEGADWFGMGGNSGGGAGLVGQDYTPLMGGPFFKNLYYYTDYIRMHVESFYAYHHDPFANFIVNLTRDFVLGTGYQVQIDQKNPNYAIAMAAWSAFEQANDFETQMDQVCEEISIYGEIMLWELPGNQTKITFDTGPNDPPPTGYIPRVRVMDPSNFVEIVTYPEDVDRKLFYVWLVPTQYQIYGGKMGNLPQGSDPALGKIAPEQPSLKFIYQTVPAEQMLHYKINCVSNEKRGRSDLFPVLGYLKRLRDSIEYSVIAIEKNSAWSIDTTIEGDQADITNYNQAMQQLGTIPSAGSEFVHTKAIERKYLAGMTGGGSSSNEAFAWCLSAIAAGVRIPISYFGVHLSGGQTRASAIVGTEPVVKKMEKRRGVMKRIITDVFNLVMKRAGIKNINCEVIFPEMITQDRSVKLQDTLLCETSGWFSPERAATIAAKEMGVDDFNFKQEMADVANQKQFMPQALIDPPGVGGSQDDSGVDGSRNMDKPGVKANDASL